MDSLSRGEIIIRRASLEDVAPIAATMREADRLEVWASSHSTPAEALAGSLALSIAAWTVERDGKPAAVFGIHAGSLVGERAAAWLLTGSEADRIPPAAFVRVGRRIVGRLLDVYPVLENWVDARYTRAIRWLRLLGAEFDPPAPFGPEGLPFCHFTLRRGGQGLGRGSQAGY